MNKEQLKYSMVWLLPSSTLTNITVIFTPVDNLDVDFYFFSLRYFLYVFLLGGVEGHQLKRNAYQIKVAGKVYKIIVLQL